jgi:Tol biopolymer transport system component
VIWRTVGVRCQGEAIARYHGLKKDHTMRLSRLTGFALISTGLASALMAMPRHTQATVTADLSGNLSRASDDGLSSTPNMDANATLSPDGKSVAFDSWRDGDGEIYVKSADGALPPLRLTRQAGFDSQPVWSPDGRRLAFISDRDGNDEIYVMDADGAHQQRLTDNPGHDWQPSWSPDGKRLAYMSDRDGNWNIYVVSIDGSERLDGSGRIQLTSSSSREGLPSWSPDGTRLAFVSDRDGDFDVYVVDADGGASRG